jgi:hypothetical protein
LLRDNITSEIGGKAENGWRTLKTSLVTHLRHRPTTPSLL